jgi:hypothetical protein
MEDLKQPTREMVLAAAASNPGSKNVLKQLWPEAFKDDRFFMRIGQPFRRSNYPEALYAIVKEKANMRIRVLNITTGDLWSDNKSIPYKDLGDWNVSHVSVSEFKKLTGLEDLNQITLLDYDAKNNVYKIVKPIVLRS